MGRNGATFFHGCACRAGDVAVARQAVLADVGNGSVGGRFWVKPHTAVPPRPEWRWPFRGGRLEDSIALVECVVRSGVVGGSARLAASSFTSREERRVTGGARTTQPRACFTSLGTADQCPRKTEAGSNDAAFIRDVKCRRAARAERIHPDSANRSAE